MHTIQNAAFIADLEGAAVKTGKVKQYLAATKHSIACRINEQSIVYAWLIKRKDISQTDYGDSRNS